MNQGKKRIIIAVDGLAASGKSTLARMLAEKLNFVCFSTGLLYRALAWAAWRDNFKLAGPESLASFLKTLHVEPYLSESKQVLVRLNGKLPGEEIYSREVSEQASVLAAQPQLREFLLPIQRSACPDSSMVVEGRDIGTVVFPDADLKFFVTADIGLRADRRLAQRSNIEDKALKLEIEKELLERDRRDTERALSPTVRARDALLIDNSAHTLTSVLESMYHHVLQRGLVK